MVTRCFEVNHSRQANGNTRSTHKQRNLHVIAAHQQPRLATAKPRGSIVLRLPPASHLAACVRGASVANGCLGEGASELESGSQIIRDRSRRSSRNFTVVVQQCRNTGIQYGILIPGCTVYQCHSSYGLFWVLVLVLVLRY